MRKVRLTPALQQQILSSIRAGGYPHVAAGSCGVPAAVFADWMARGERKRARPPYASFAAEVNLAHAQARLRAEVEALQKDPRSWLAHGPGRESGSKPGWSTAVKPREVGEGSEYGHAELLELFRLLLEALTPFPEARAAAAQKLHEHGFAANDKSTV